MGASFSAAISRDQIFGLHLREPTSRQPLTPPFSIYMKASLLAAAAAAIPNQQILVNVVSRRVRQLTLGHRPLVVCAPGLGSADIALTEIAEGKLTYESTFGQNEKDVPAQVVQFPGTTVSRKKAA